MESSMLNEEQNKTVNYFVEILKDIAVGKRPLRLVDPEMSWERTYAGNVKFVSDGVSLIVFNDCDEWDYIDSIQNDTTSLDFPYTDCAYDLLSPEDQELLEKLCREAI